MPKHDFLSPKAISNRIKAKGLQKLRWYCDMCQKQCRDENGFKCHCASEAHLRQMKVFSESPGTFISKYSREFTSGFMSLLRMRGRKKVFANVVYNEYIKDRHHVHMKSTHWTSLSGFVQYLGKTGRAEIEKGERGWFITYIEKDPQKAADEQAKERLGKLEMDEQMRNDRRIEMQIKHSKPESSSVEETCRQLKRKNSDDEKISFSFSKREKKMVSNVFQDQDEEADVIEQPVGSSLVSPGSWLLKGILVKYMDKSFEQAKYYKKKGVVLQVYPSGDAQLLIIQSHEIVDHVTCDKVVTVTPSVTECSVRFVRGEHKGKIGTLKVIDKLNASADISIELSNGTKEMARNVPFQDFSKMAPVK